MSFSAERCIQTVCLQENSTGYLQFFLLDRRQLNWQHQDASREFVKFKVTQNLQVEQNSAQPENLTAT